MMRSKRMARGAAVVALAAALTGLGTSVGLAQEYLGSAVTLDGGTSGVSSGDVVVVAPGVTISGGTVVNATGIGVDSGGGSSVGAATGGDTNAALVE